MGKILKWPVGLLATLWISWCGIWAHHVLSNMPSKWLTRPSPYSLLRTKVIWDHVKDLSPKSEESRSQWNEKQASRFHLWLGRRERKREREREREEEGWREREKREVDQEFPFFPNELTEATSISSNVMLKWKLIVQYAATALGYTLLPFPYRVAWPNECACSDWCPEKLIPPLIRQIFPSDIAVLLEFWKSAFLYMCVSVSVCVCVCVCVCACRSQTWGPIVQGMQMEWASLLMKRWIPLNKDWWLELWQHE